jgi:sugar phosphate isomerase/epimerase
VISFMTANFVASETGWAMHGWAHGDRATNERFEPLDTYEERLDELLTRVRSLGFDAIDLWGAHLAPGWATDDHLAIANDVLARHGLTVSTYATWVGPSNVRRSCELARGLGVDVIGGGMSGDPSELARVLAEHGVRLAIENHPERTPAELLAKIESGAGTMGATVDTGWWATQDYDPARAIEELAASVLHVHLKDVRSVGEPHVTCRWGDGIVDVEACVRTLRKLGYRGAFAVEHEPEDHDPSAECASMRDELQAWLR